MINTTSERFVRPTISLYLGGSGILCGEQFRYMRATMPSQERPLLQPLFIDSQKPRIDDYARSRHYYYKRLSIFDEPVYREFKEARFPENLGRSPVYDSSDGCGVTRIFGAGSLVENRDNFMDLLSGAVSRIRRHGDPAGERIQVLLTSSSCGGTGAGMLIDAAAMVRHFFRSQVGEAPRILMFLLGPEVFFEDPSISLAEEARERMVATSYALIKELHHYAQGNPFVSAYRLRDEVVRISNLSEDDRLFDWVFLTTGQSDRAPTLSRDELAWSVAEAQFHLSTSEAGYKVTESLPNLREERDRQFALDYVHPDHKDTLTGKERGLLRQSSRRSFLATLGVGNVRFPGPEIGSVFRSRWVRESVEMMLERSVEGPHDAVRDEYDRLLGLSDGVVSDEGFLADLGLSASSLRAIVGDAVVELLGSELQFTPRMEPDRLIDGGTALLDGVTDLVSNASASAEPTEEMEQSLELWRTSWVDASKSRERQLLRLALHPTRGRGLRWLEGFLERVVEALNELSEEPPVADLGELVEVSGRARLSLRSLSSACSRERSRLTFRAKTLWSRAQGRTTPPYSTGSLGRARRLAVVLRDLQEKVATAQVEELSAWLAARAVEEAAASLVRWRRDSLTPLLTSLENSLAHARSEQQSAERSLQSYRGAGPHGDWVAHSTTQLCDSDLFEKLRERVERRFSIEESVLAKFWRDGISWERHRLSPERLGELEPRDTVRILAKRIDDESRQILDFLEMGWSIEELGERQLEAAAAVLDQKAESLLKFSQAAVGVRSLGYFVAPSVAPLDADFGQVAGRLSRIDGTDPQQLSVVRFFFGIPPNCLDQIRDMFRAYGAHLGDETKHDAQDRYPLHVVRGAATRFDEPLSPPDLSADEKYLTELLAIAEELSLVEQGRISLAIREFEAKLHVLQDDRNKVVELQEELSLHFSRRPEHVAEVLGNGEFPRFKRFIRQHWWHGEFADATSNGSDGESHPASGG